MSWFKRIGLLLAINFLVVLTISLLLSVFNVQPYLTNHGLDMQALLIFCLLWGMGGAFLSLALSKQMAKWMMKVQIIPADTRDPRLRLLVQEVHSLAKTAGLSVMPDVGIYAAHEVNAFATGPSRQNSLVAVSSGLLQRMSPREIQGVLGHEIAHIANGDMVTMTLVQGVVNAFVMFLARAIAFFLTRSDRRENSGSSYFMYHMIVIGLQSVLMIFGSMAIAAYSRWREYRADAGGACLAGKDCMLSALEGLKRNNDLKDLRGSPPTFQAFKISNPNCGLLSLFASHPPLDARIAALRKIR